MEFVSACPSSSPVLAGNCSVAIVEEGRMREYLDFLMAKVSVRRTIPLVNELSLNESGRDVDGRTEQENEEEVEENRLLVEEAVFMQSYIPVSLHEISNPYAEADRLRAGQREPAYQAALHKMLGTTSQTVAREASRPDPADESPYDDSDDDDCDDLEGPETNEKPIPECNNNRIFFLI